MIKDLRFRTCTPIMPKTELLKEIKYLEGRVKYLEEHARKQRKRLDDIYSLAILDKD